MARIRTVKPELWSDPEFVECSPMARLLFVALWNFASDFGVLPDKPKQLKMQCLPGDNCDIDALLGELIAQRFVVRTTAPTGENVLVVRTFTDHQRVDRPSKGRYGDPREWGNPQPQPETDSTSPRRVLDESSTTEGKGREGKGITSVGLDDSPGAVENLDRPTDEDPRLRAVIDLIADDLIERFPTRASPNGHRARVTADVLARHGPLITSRLQALPHSPPSTVATSLAREIR